MRRAVLALTALLLTAASACSVVDDGKVSSIDPPGGLDDTLPPTAPTSSTDVTSSTVVNSSTTLVQTEPVRLYFIASGRLTYVNVPIASPVQLSVIISALQFGPPAETFGLRTAVPADLVVEVETNNDGIAQVNLPDDFFDQVSISDQRLVIGQIVLTLTDSRGIGQVVFNQPVPKPLGEAVGAGEPVTYRDYAALVGSGPITSSGDDSVTSSEATSSSVGG